MTGKRGAGKGNKNALKHGIFSKFIAVQDDEEMEGMAKDKNIDELALARTQLKYSMTMRENATDDELRLKWDVSIRHWAEIIDNMIARNVEKRETEELVWESFMDAIRAANDRQKVRR